MEEDQYIIPIILLFGVFIILPCITLLLEGKITTIKVGDVVFIKERPLSFLEVLGLNVILVLYGLICLLYGAYRHAKLSKVW